MPNTPEHVKTSVHRIMVKSQGKKQETLPKSTPTPKHSGRAVKRLTRSERKIPKRILNIMWRNKVPYATAVALSGE